MPVDSFRFDFRSASVFFFLSSHTENDSYCANVFPNSGNHESGGTWRHGSPEGEIVDLSVVVDYLKGNYGYEVDLLVAHSRGALVAFNWLCTSEYGKNVGGFVNVSGRYRMRVSWKEKPPSPALIFHTLFIIQNYCGKLHGWTYRPILSELYFAHSQMVHLSELGSPPSIPKVTTNGRSSSLENKSSGGYTPRTLRDWLTGTLPLSGSNSPRQPTS